MTAITTLESLLQTEYAVWLPVFIFFARICDVSIGTLRLICVTRGRRSLAVALGFFEVLIWLLSISGVFSHLNNWLNIAAYAGGFAAGNAVGMWIEQKLAMGTQIVRLLSRGSAHAVAEGLRLGGIQVTSFLGNGGDGPVAICFAIVPRKRTRKVLELARDIDPDVVITVEDTTVTANGQAATQLPGKFPLRLFRTRPAATVATARDDTGFAPFAAQVADEHRLTC